MSFICVKLKTTSSFICKNIFYQSVSSDEKIFMVILDLLFYVLNYNTYIKKVQKHKKITNCNFTMYKIITKYQQFYHNVYKDENVIM